jgi:hypothetical protein
MRYQYSVTYALHDEIMARYGLDLLIPSKWAQDEVVAFIVIHPRFVDDALHVVIHDRELRDRVRQVVQAGMTNDPSPNAVLVLAPVQ